MVKPIHNKALGVDVESPYLHQTQVQQEPKKTRKSFNNKVFGFFYVLKSFMRFRDNHVF